MRSYRLTDMEISCDNLIPLSDGKKEQFNTECNSFLINNLLATFSVKVYPFNTINNSSEIKAILICVNRSTCLCMQKIKRCSRRLLKYTPSGLLLLTLHKLMPHGVNFILITLFF